MLMRLLIRWGFALVLVMATYNPTKWNLVRWGMDNYTSNLPVVDQGWLDIGNATAMTWIGLIALSFVLGIGMTWSIIRRAISGQLDVDDIEE